MDKLDQSIRSMIKAEAPKMPDYFSGTYDKTVDSLTGVNEKQLNILAEGELDVVVPEVEGEVFCNSKKNLL